MGDTKESLLIPPQAHDYMYIVYSVYSTLPSTIWRVQHFHHSHAEFLLPCTTIPPRQLEVCLILSLIHDLRYAQWPDLLRALIKILSFIGTLDRNVVYRYIYLRKSSRSPQTSEPTSIVFF